MREMAVIPVTSQPVGVRFSPTDKELVNHYLLGKINGRESEVKLIKEVDFCKCEPWELPDRVKTSLTRPGDLEWFFFSRRGRKYPKGNRSARATKKGYWKATGKDRRVKHHKKVIGTKKTLVFYEGRARGVRTPWKMHEYQTKGGQPSYVLCRLFYKPDEEKASSSCDDVDQIDLLPTTTTSSPNNSQHAGDVVVGQFENTPLNQRTSESNVQESPQPLPEPIGNQLVDSDRMLNDESDGVTSDPLTAEEPKDDFLQECLRVIIDPPEETFDAESLLQMHLMHSELIGSPRKDFSCYDAHNEKIVAPDPSEAEFCDSMLNNDGGYSCIESTGQKGSIEPRSHEVPWNFHGIFTISTDAEVAKTEGYSELDASRWFRRPAPSVGLDVSSTDSNTVHRVNYINIVESPPDHESLSNGSNGLDVTGVNIRDHQQSRAIPHTVPSQGFAVRRIRLRMKIQRGSVSRNGEESRGDARAHQKITEEEAVEDATAMGSGVSGLVESLQSWKPLQSWKQGLPHVDRGKDVNRGSKSEVENQAK